MSCVFPWFFIRLKTARRHCVVERDARQLRRESVIRKPRLKTSLPDVDSQVNVYMNICLFFSYYLSTENKKTTSRQDELT